MNADLWEISVHVLSIATYYLLPSTTSNSVAVDSYYNLPGEGDLRYPKAQLGASINL